MMGAPMGQMMPMGAMPAMQPGMMPGQSPLMATQQPHPQQAAKNDIFGAL